MTKLAVLLLAVANALPSGAQQEKSLLTLEELIGDWKVSKEFTLAVAETMPAEHYDFKPNLEQRSFGEQMVHIAAAQAFRFAQLTGRKSPVPLQPGKADKESAIRLLNQSFDYVIGVLPRITPEQMAKTFQVDWKGRPEVNGRQMMLNMLVHTAHHRAQCEVYLRLKNIKPPDYTF